MALQTIDADQIISIRHDIAVCPYCNAPLYVTSIPGMSEDDHGWKADEIELTCGSEPHLESDEWGEWLKQHSFEPYVNQLPVEMKVIEWLNRHFRFAI